MVGRPFQSSGSGWETLSEVRKWSGDTPEVRKWSQTLPEVWNWLGDLSRGPEVVARPFRRSGCGRVTLPEVRY